MCKIRVLFLVLFAAGVCTLLLGIDRRDVEIIINMKLADHVVFRPAYLLTVGALRQQGMEVIEFTIANNSQEPILVGPDLCGPMLLPAKEKLANIFWQPVRGISLTLSTIGVLGIAGAGGYSILSCMQVMKQKRLPMPLKIIFGLSLTSIISVSVLTAIQTYLWNRASQKFLYDMFTIEPGQVVQKFMIFDESALPKNFSCRIRDMHNTIYAIQALIV